MFDQASTQGVHLRTSCLEVKNLIDDTVPVLKDEDHQRPIPSAWRDTFTEIVEALKKGDYEIINNISGVCTVSTEDASRITRNIEG